VSATVDSAGAAGAAVAAVVSSPSSVVPRTPLALLRAAATVLPPPLLVRFLAVMTRSLNRSHPRLLRNLEQLEPAVVHIAPTDLPYRLVLNVGRVPVTLDITGPGATGADATVAASVATLVDLLEGRSDSDTLFFRRDLTISGNTSIVVGLRNVLDREELILADELALPLGPLGPPARAVARVLERVLDGIGARVAAMHRTLHPPTESGPDVASELDQCRSEIAALTARLGRLEARQKRRSEMAE
jgi:predicted lipid carrier protein YhbT